MTYLWIGIFSAVNDRPEPVEHVGISVNAKRLRQRRICGGPACFQLSLRVEIDLKSVRLAPGHLDLTLPSLASTSHGGDILLCLLRRSEFRGLFFSVRGNWMPDDGGSPNSIRPSIS